MLVMSRGPYVGQGLSGGSTSIGRQSAGSSYPGRQSDRVETLAGLKPSGGHHNEGRKQLRNLCLIEEARDLVAATGFGLAAAGKVPAAPSTRARGSGGAPYRGC